MRHKHVMPRRRRTRRALLVIAAEVMIAAALAVALFAAPTDKPAPVELSPEMTPPVHIITPEPSPTPTPEPTDKPEDTPAPTWDVIPSLGDDIDPEPTPEPSEEDIDIIATVVYNEAWCGCTDRHRDLVAAVVCNRVKSDKFPDSVFDVVTQKGQYLKSYAYAESAAGIAARADPDIWAECREIARRALCGEVDCPEDVLYQSEFVLGRIYEASWTSYSTTYFCYG